MGAEKTTFQQKVVCPRNVRMANPRDAHDASRRIEREIQRQARDTSPRRHAGNSLAGLAADGYTRPTIVRLPAKRLHEGARIYRKRRPAKSNPLKWWRRTTTAI